MADPNQIFRHPSSWRWRFLVSTPFWLLGCFVMIVGPIATGSIFVLVLAPIGCWGVIHVVVKLHLLAARVHVDEAGLVATTFLGRTVRVRWRDVRRIEVDTPRYGLGDWSTAIRVSDRLSGRSFFFTDAISGYDRLTDQIRANAAHVRWQSLPLVLRVLRG